MTNTIKSTLLFIHNSLSRKRITTRSGFLKKIQNTGKILEIGPFTNPSIRGENVFYFDVLNKDDLIKRAAVEKYTIADINNIPEIDYVSPDGDLSIIRDKFDCAYSSHCIEHQPNLIKHLIDVSNVLSHEGKYYLAIPDKRYCFDALLPETNIASVIEAYNENKTRHSLANIIQHGALTTHNSPYKHWLGLHGTIDNVPSKIKSMLKVYDNLNGQYYDVHSWRFTPDTFINLINLLNQMGYIRFSISEVFHTAFCFNEFYVVLQKNS